MTDSNIQNPAQQAGLLVQHVQEEVLGPFWQAQQQSNSQYDQGFRTAKERLADIEMKIVKNRKDLKFDLDKVNLKPREQNFNKLKNDLRIQVNGIKDLNMEAQKCIINARRYSKSADTWLEFTRLLGLLVKIFAVIGGGVVLLTVIDGAFYFSDFILPILILLISLVVVMILAIKYLLVRREFHRSAAQASLVLERWQRQAEDEYVCTCAEIKEHHAQKLEEIRKRFFLLLSPANRRFREFKDRADFPEVAWEHQCWQNWNPVSMPPTVVRFGILRVDTSWSLEQPPAVEEA